VDFAVGSVSVWADDRGPMVMLSVNKVWFMIKLILWQRVISKYGPEIKNKA
jgi:hypothetical protein